MYKIKKFYVIIEKGGLVNEKCWLQMIFVIEGLSYGLCSIPDKTTWWDIELYENKAILHIDCTKEHFDEFRKNVEKAFPGVCTYEEAQ